TYDLELERKMLPSAPTWFERTLFGQRRFMADWLRLQIYGLAWRNTGIDHVNPRFFRAPVANLNDSEGVSDRDAIQPGIVLSEYLAFDVLASTMQHMQNADVPIVLVNEPIFI